MKSIMYHYVREPSAELPFFRFLHIDDFRRQLDHFQSEFGFVSKEDFLASFKTGIVPDGVVLTFDDGLMDHHHYVFPELQQRGLWGIFYVPTYPYETGKMLDVHRVHALIGLHGGERLLEATHACLSSEMISEQQKADFNSIAYAKHKEDEATRLAKKILNYYTRPEFRRELLDRVCHVLFDDEQAFSKTYYASLTELKEMKDAGMIIGSHSIDHMVMSTLSPAEQDAQIRNAYALLERHEVLSEPRTFCYPYGGFHSFNDTTEAILTDAQTLYSFNVEARAVEQSDIMQRPQALPRFDCNHFPHGSIWTAAV